MVGTTVLLSGSHALKYSRLGRHVLLVFSCLLCSLLCCRIVLGQELCRKSSELCNVAANLQLSPLQQVQTFTCLYMTCYISHVIFVERLSS